MARRVSPNSTTANEAVAGSAVPFPRAGIGARAERGERAQIPDVNGTGMLGRASSKWDSMRRRCAGSGDLSPGFFHVPNTAREAVRRVGQIPRRDASFDWTAPVDGSDPATSYRGLLSLDETRTSSIRARAGCSTRQTGRGRRRRARTAAPRPTLRRDGTERRRAAIHALRVTSGAEPTGPCARSRKAAFDSYLPAFERLLPPALRGLRSGAARATRSSSGSRPSRRAPGLGSPLGWRSVPTTLAIWWGERACVASPSGPVRARLARRPTSHARRAEDLLRALADASTASRPCSRTWKKPWGEVNRFQRIDDAIESTSTTPAPASRCRSRREIWGSARLVRRARLSRHAEMVRRFRQQLVAVVEFGDNPASHGRHGPAARADTRERGTRRPGGALRERQAASRLFPSRGARAPHGARVSPGDSRAAP